jgi:hypothetical protein
VNDVTLGVGNLAGRGVYAARDFAAGEIVVDYRLQPLDDSEFEALPDGDDRFAHSFGGRRYLYPPPARYVNHSDNPSCFEDFDRSCDVAIRALHQGEAITIDARQETARELATFLDAYCAALSARSAPLIEALVDSEATLWSSGPSARGRDAVVAALLHRGPVELSGVEWIVGTGRWEAVCSADEEAATGHQHVTMVLKVVKANWQLIYRHAG